MSKRHKKKLARCERLPNPHLLVPRSVDPQDISELGEPDGYIVVDGHPMAYWMPKARPDAR